MRFASLLLRFLVAGVICFFAHFAQAGTILKLNLGGVGPDLGMNAGGILSTTDDGDASTVGQQDTAIEFTGFLDPANPDINSPVASFTLTGLTASGPVQLLGSLAIQNFAGGQFNLYDPANSLLLSGNLTTSALSGTIGQPATGAVFTTAPVLPTSGSLAPSIASLSLSISMINVNGGSGLGVSGNALQPFLADASVLIAGDPQVNAPEPSTIALLCLGGIGLFMRRRFARSA